MLGLMLLIGWLVSLGLLGILLLIGIIMWVKDYFQVTSSIKRNFPILGRGRYIAEHLRPKLYQYFIESDIDGRPFNRLDRSVIYQRAKNELDTNPFGTQLDTNEIGYEWMNHSIAAINHEGHQAQPRLRVGGSACTQPYDCSLLNVSAMSFGSLSKNAVLALNGGAKIGAFAHNTGEGGVSPYHLEPGGDLIYQIGTGYFGCRADNGPYFDAEKYKVSAGHDSVKMIELKLSQGAKPGHGGILPAKKNTEEIAAIRGVKPHTSVNSPPGHTAFDNPKGLLKFIQELRDLSGGKPVGFKLCIGRPSEFIGICKAMVETGIKPDFISIDGGEGGTGAAPLEFSNSVGMPGREGVAFAYDALVGFDLKKDIVLGAAGKIVTGFDMFKAFALGADICNSARAMMMALGCIQALECNKNTCPTGITSQDPKRVRGLDVNDKKVRVASYHEDTIISFQELLAAAGLREVKDIHRHHINRRVEYHKIMRYDELYPYVAQGALLKSESEWPERFKPYMERSSADSFWPTKAMSH